MRSAKRSNDYWTKLSERSFAKDWDSHEDAVYDKWKSSYKQEHRKADKAKGLDQA
jgi:hypothetical protein